MGLSWGVLIVLPKAKSQGQLGKGKPISESRMIAIQEKDAAAAVRQCQV
jgi:hypothetical protein